jgi:hypothetical protein
MTRADVEACVERVLARTAPGDLASRLALSLLLIELRRLDSAPAQSMSDRRAILSVVRRDADDCKE